MRTRRLARLSSVGVRTTRINEDQEVSQLSLVAKITTNPFVVLKITTSEEIFEAVA